ncbi:MAG: L-serine ammonia-lyase, iron-sulfur-dependent, subunit alpha [Candidatus Diapherotrites archaeon]
MTEFWKTLINSNKTIWKTTLERECQIQRKNEKEIMKEMQKRLEIMEKAAKKGIKEEITTKSGLVKGNAKKFYEKTRTKKVLLNELTTKAIAYALAVSEVNASMGIIVAAPTAGSCGILPGATIAMMEEINNNKEKGIKALLTAAGIGLIIQERATFAAAVAGCGAEIGASAAMTSAAIVEFCEGTKKQALNAAAITLKSYLGLACDPIAGLVEVPCIKRNAIAVANSFASAEMALAGIESAVPFNEVVDTMLRIGKKLPLELRETSKGGLATTETALKIKLNNCNNQIFNLIKPKV